MIYRRQERGVATVYFVLLAGAVIFGFMVMSIDFGRLYLIQGELQTAADAAALAAATQLVGTVNSTLYAGDSQSGQVGAAFDTTDTFDNRFNLHINQIGAGSTDLVTSVLVDFFSTRLDALANVAGGQTGPNAKYARVFITAQAPVLFPQFINPSFGSRPTVVASAVAGISAPICTACGIDVLAIVDRAGADPVDFGLTEGSFYTLYLDASMQAAPIGPACTTTTPTDITTLNNPTLAGSGIVNYVILDHVPTGGLIDPDGTLFELTAAGMESSDNDTIGTPGAATLAGTTGLPEAVFGSYTGLIPTTGDPGQDVICGLNNRFGVDPASATPCDSVLGGEFLALAPAFTGVADTDQGNAGGYAAGGDGFLQDFGSEYDGNRHRVLTVPVVDDPSTLNVLGFRQFLLETDPAAPIGTGLNPAVGTAGSCQGGAFPAQYMGWPVPLRCGNVGGSCTVSFGVGRTVLH